VKVKIIVIVLILAVVIQVVRPVPNLTVKGQVDSLYQIPTNGHTIPWPTTGESALAVAGIGVIGTHGENQAMPIASLAKMMTALIVLKKHPLATGADGPSLTVTAADVNLFQQDNATGQSLLQVQAGEKLTERQMLEALLLPSANNVANMLGQWIDGSDQAFVAEMNATAKQLGMSHTVYLDESGYNPATVSTAADQLKVAEADMQIQTFRDIVKMPQATLPIAGTVINVDYVLGQNGIVGIKTGSTPEAGGCFVFAAYHTVGNHNLLILGSVLGQQGTSELMTALNEGKTLVKAASDSVTTVTALQAGTPVASISAPWADSVTVTAPKTVSFIGWPGLVVHRQLKATALGSHTQAGAGVGSLTVSMGNQKATMPLHVSNTIKSPSYLWRLKRT